MTRYAANTDVSSHRSRDEIERILTRYGADQFMYARQDGENAAAMIRFRKDGIHIKFVLPMPDRDDPEFTQTPAKARARSADAAERAYEQAIKQKWRALSLVIKAKLEAVESGIAIFEEEFVANIVLPNGQTVGQFMLPQIEAAYETADMPPLLPDYSSPTTGDGS
jgi:hypothetical protein